jgi:hypothetical protein
MRIRRAVALLVVVALVHLSVPVSAHTSISVTGIREAILELGSGPETSVTVQLRNGTTTRGYVQSIHAHSFFVVDPQTGAVTQVPFGGVQKMHGRSATKTMVITIAIIAGALAVIALLNLRKMS